MGQFKFHWEGTSGVPAASARAWFFDLTENDHSHPDHAKLFKTPPTRKILSRTKDEVRTEENFGRGPMQATLRLAGPDAISSAWTGKGMSSEGLIRFTPAGKTTQIVIDTTFHTKGLMALMAPLMRKKMSTMIAADMKIHVKEMEEDWKKKPW